MTNTMTSSEIADWLDWMSDEFTDLSPAAATIRDLESKLRVATEALKKIELMRFAACETSLADSMTEIAKEALASMNGGERSLTPVAAVA